MVDALGWLFGEHLAFFEVPVPTIDARITDTTHKAADSAFGYPR